MAVQKREGELEEREDLPSFYNFPKSKSKVEICLIFIGQDLVTHVRWWPHLWAATWLKIEGPTLPRFACQYSDLWFSGLPSLWGPVFQT